MPHVIVEYSGNIEPDVDMSAVCELLRGAATTVEIFPIPWIRVRAYRANHYAIADSDPKQGFITIGTRRLRMNILSFHESTVTTFLVKKNSFVIGLERVSTDCSSDKVEITVENIYQVLIDSVPAVGISLKMPCSDGEVLTLELSEENFFILIEWNDFSLGNTFTQSYEIIGSNAQASII